MGWILQLMADFWAPIEGKSRLGSEGPVVGLVGAPQYLDRFVLVWIGQRLWKIVLLPFGPVCLYLNLLY